MKRRYRAETIMTLGAALLMTAMLVLIIGVVTASLGESNPVARDDATSAIWTVAPVLIFVAAFCAWLLARFVFTPIADLGKALSLNARARALAETPPTDLHEIAALRNTVLRVVREMEAELRAAEAEKRHLGRLLEDISEGIAHIDRHGRFVLLNHAARRLLELPSHPEGQAASALIRNGELRAIVARAVGGEELAPLEVSIANRQLLVAPQTLPEATGDGGAIITVVDLTELRRLESVRRDFVANVSHELKTPLTSIRGYAETLLADDVSRQDQLQFLEVIHKNATRLQRIVEELLDLSRLESGGWTPALQDVDLSGAAREAWSSCEAIAQGKRINFTLRGDAAQVRADPGALQQVFTNIYENAVRYTPEGGTIIVTISSHATTATAEIKDNGIGIPAPLLPRIFERFYRVDPARSRAAGGTGLGLAIVKHLVERMGGVVTARSAVGAGTVLRVELPRSMP